MIIGQDSDNKTYEPKLDICGTVSAVNMPAVQGNEASKTNLVALDVTGNEVKKNAQRTRWSLCAFNDNGQRGEKSGIKILQSQHIYDILHILSVYVSVKSGVRPALSY